MPQFARLFPLTQRDLPVEPKHVDFGPLMPKSLVVDNPSRDYTPPREPLHPTPTSDTHTHTHTRLTDVTKRARLLPYLHCCRAVPSAQATE